MQGRIVINPQVLSDERDALAVAYNEAYRAVMEMQNFVPQAEPTQEQLQFFADTAYANDPLMMKRTIVARIATYDSSVPNPTPEQYMDTVNMLQMVMDAGVIQTPEEEEIVSSTLEDMKQSANAPAPMEAVPEEMLEALGPDATGEMPQEPMAPDPESMPPEGLPPELLAAAAGGGLSPDVSLGGIPTRSADGGGNVSPTIYSLDEQGNITTGTGEVVKDNRTQVQGVNLNGDQIADLKKKFGDDWVKYSGVRAQQEAAAKRAAQTKDVGNQVADVFRGFTSGLKLRGAGDQDLGLGAKDSEIVSANVGTWAKNQTDDELIARLNDAERAKVISSTYGVHKDKQEWMDLTINALYKELQSRGDLTKGNIEDRRQTQQMIDLGRELGYNEEELKALTFIEEGTRADQDTLDKRRTLRRDLGSKIEDFKKKIIEQEQTALNSYNDAAQAYNKNIEAALKIMADTDTETYLSDQEVRSLKDLGVYDDEIGFNLSEQDLISGFRALDEQGNFLDEKAKLRNWKASGDKARKELDAKANTLKQALEVMTAADERRRQGETAYLSYDANASLDSVETEALLKGGAGYHDLTRRVSNDVNDIRATLGEATRVVNALQSGASLGWTEGINDDFQEEVNRQYDEIYGKMEALGFDDVNDVFGVDLNEAAENAYRALSHFSDAEKAEAIRWAAYARLEAEHGSIATPNPKKTRMAEAILAAAPRFARDMMMGGKPLRTRLTQR